MEHYQKKDFQDKRNESRGFIKEKHADQRNFVDDFEEKWITTGINPDCIKFTKEFGKFLAENRLSSSQIRNVYGELKRIQMKGFNKERTSFLLLRPKMAYADKRNEGAGLRQLKKVFDKAHELVESEDHFNHFMDFMEATLAYHKAFGGKS